jgi:deoxycytidylate deaminase
MRLLCAAGITDIKYIEDYRNDELCALFSEMAGVPIVQLPLQKEKDESVKSMP